MKTFVLVTLALLYANATYAACENERSERDKARSDCNQLSAASAATGTFGFIINPVGGVLGLIPGVAAKHNCEIADNKDKDLTKCLDKADEELTSAEQAAQTRVQYFAMRKRQEYTRLTEEQKAVAARRAQADKKKASIFFEKALTKIEIQHAEAVMKARQDFEFNLQRFNKTLAERGMDAQSSPGKEFYADFYIRAERGFKHTLSSIDQYFGEYRTEFLKRAAAAGFPLEAK